MDVVQLEPAVPDLPFERAVLWLDRQDALPRKLADANPRGSVRTSLMSIALALLAPATSCGTDRRP